MKENQSKKSGAKKVEPVVEVEALEDIEEVEVVDVEPEVDEEKDGTTPDGEEAQELLLRELLNDEMSLKPLPHPSILVGYEKVLPGSAERIFKMSENQKQHSQDMERERLRNKNRERLLSVIFGFILGLVGLGIGLYLSVIGETYVSIAIFVVTIVGIVGIFIYKSAFRFNLQDQEKDDDDE